MWIEILGTLVRAVLMVLAGWMIEHGVWTAEQAGRYVPYLSGGVVVLLVAVGWGVWQKVKARAKFLLALESPQGTSEAAIKAQMRR